MLTIGMKRVWDFVALPGPKIVQYNLLLLENQLTRWSVHSYPTLRYWITRQIDSIMSLSVIIALQSNIDLELAFGATTQVTIAGLDELGEATEMCATSCLIGPQHLLTAEHVFGKPVSYTHLDVYKRQE